MSEKSFTTSLNKGVLKINMAGRWTTDNASSILKEIKKLRVDQNAKSLLLDAANIVKMDTAGGLCLLRLQEAFRIESVDYQNFSAPQKEILNLVLKNSEPTSEPEKHARVSLLTSLGFYVEEVLKPVASLTSFLGVLLSKCLLQPADRIKGFRIKEFLIQFDRSLLQAIPVIALVTALIGVVVSYLFSTQIEKYGANIYIVDSVALAMGRELSPLIVATVLAGRSGSAFTAQIGSMVLTQEIDAIKTMGLDVLDVIVIPRILALILALPVLVLIGDVVSLAGGAIIAENTLDITLVTFLDRLQQIRPQHFISGLVKAPFFAFTIALIGCKAGLSVEPNARSVGLSTTSTVVQSIVAVILIDSVFAVMFMQMGY